MPHAARVPRRRTIAAAAAVFSLALLSWPGRVGAQSPSTEPAAPAREVDPFAWPPETAESRPWARWWWLGSGVDPRNLTRLLEAFADAGLGGVEICPIYGAKGFENRNVDFLSPKWMEMLAHTTREADRLGMGVDLTTGTGWPFGGPGVSDAEASSKVVLKRYDVAAGATLSETLPKGRLECLTAVSDAGKQIDLAGRAAPDGRLEWTAPQGNGWRVYAVLGAGPIQKVKRAAPGGAGNVLDPFSVPALDDYLARFDRALAGFGGVPPRAHFHDSFEYFGANWTPNLLREFQSRRGYDLRSHVAALFGDGEADTVARVKADLRATIAELHLEYVTRWTAWANGHGGASRNQAHGAPGNLLDLYAAADIPETEIFKQVDEQQIPMLKFASSAANVTGRPLVSSESFTWLGEHFQVPLSEVKPAADFLFLGGINHVFYHGIPYSPADAKWPGWLFYASVHFGPGGGLWQDLPALNAYIARVQSVMQSGRPASDVLLYFPAADAWHNPEGLLMPFTVHGQEKWLYPTTFYKAAMTLWEAGYPYDAVSDRLLTAAECDGDDGAILLGGNEYRVIVVPRCRVMPTETLRKLTDLARQGATVLFLDEMPTDVPGLARLDQRRAEFRRALDGVRLKEIPVPAGAPAGTPPGPKVATVGTGRIVVSPDLDGVLRAEQVMREPMTDQGLRFVRRVHPYGGYHYFVVNGGERPVDGWVTLGTPVTSAVLFDPLRVHRRHRRRAAGRVGLAAGVLADGAGRVADHPHLRRARRARRRPGVALPPPRRPRARADRHVAGGVRRRGSRAAGRLPDRARRVVDPPRRQGGQAASTAPRRTAWSSTCPPASGPTSGCSTSVRSATAPASASTGAWARGLVRPVPDPGRRVPRPKPQRAGARGDEPRRQPHRRLRPPRRGVEGVPRDQLREHRLQTLRRLEVVAAGLGPDRPRATRADAEGDAVRGRGSVTTETRRRELVLRHTWIDE